jgi:hypothetical protein
MFVALSTVGLIISNIEGKEIWTAVRNALSVFEGVSFVANRAFLLSGGVASDTSGVSAFVAV